MALTIFLLIGSTPVIAGEIDASVDQPSESVDLSAEGLADWVHWGLVNASSVNRKLAGGQRIGDFVPLLLASQPGRFGDARTRFGWSDGTPTASVSATTGGLFFSGVGNGYELSVAARVDSNCCRIRLRVCCTVTGRKGRIS